MFQDLSLLYIPEIKLRLFHEQLGSLKTAAKDGKTTY
jgi:hypothetical protein